MKRNALIRIILWGCLLIFLLYALFGMLYSMHWNKNAVSVVEVTMPPASVSFANTAYAAEEVNIRSSPSLEAEVVGMLHSGAAVEIQLEETVNGSHWAFLSYPVTGWVLMEYLENEAVPLETSVFYGMPDSGEAFTVSADAVRNLEIDWVAGNILIQPIDTPQIRIEETEVDNKKDALVWKLKNGQLSIDFCEDDDRFVFQGTELRKDLTIYVPMDWNCASLELDVASANVEINDLTIGEVEFDGASGKCSFGNCIVDRLDIDTASGDIRYTGTLGILECDAASANVLAVFENVPNRLAMDTMSGSLDITLPEDAGFTLDMDSMQKNFSSEFEDITVQNEQYIRGDGSCRIRISAMSGDVMLRKAPGA